MTVCKCLIIKFVDCMALEKLSLVRMGAAIFSVTSRQEGDIRWLICYHTNNLICGEKKMIDVLVEDVRN